MGAPEYTRRVIRCINPTCTMSRAPVCGPKVKIAQPISQPPNILTAQHPVYENQQVYKQVQGQISNIEIS